MTFLTFFTLPTGHLGIFTLNIALIGLVSIPIMPLCFSFAVELTYPTPEPMSNGMMILPSKICGAILGLIVAALAEINPMLAVTVFFINTVTGVATSLLI
jgi:hypothetical protein